MAKNEMNIIIAGGGEVGLYLTDQFSSEGHNVTVIESDEDKLQKIAERFDVMTIRGSSADLKILSESGAAKAQLFIAATDNDEINLLAAAAAKQLGSKRTVARVRTAEYAAGRYISYKQFFNIDLIVNPLLRVGMEVAKLVSTPGVLGVDTFADGKVEMHEVTLGEDSRAVGKELRHLEMGSAGLIVAIRRQGQFLIPSGKTDLRAGDIVYAIGMAARINKIESLLGKDVSQRRLIIIFGGGPMALTIAKMLEPTSVDVKIIEQDPDRATYLAENLKKALVLVGDGNDVTLLKEEQIEKADLFLAAAGDDEDNIISCILAKRLGVKMVVPVVERADYLNILTNLGIDSAICPRLLTAASIMRYVRRGNIRSVAILEDGQAEMAEIVVEPKSRVAGKALKDMKLPEGVLIGSIVRKDEVIVPRGSDELAEGDTVILFTHPKNLQDLERLFATR